MRVRITAIGALAGAFFACVLNPFSMAKSSYASFNTLTITGRLSHAEVVDGQYGKYLAVTLLSELVDEGEAIAVNFTNTNGLMTLFTKGYLKNGRRITVTGHLESFAEIYFDKTAGKAKRLQRPRLKLAQAQVLAGGLGPAKKADSDMPAGDIEIDDTPEMPVAAGSTLQDSSKGEINF